MNHIDRPLALTRGLRSFEHEGRGYAHVSAVPLTYLSLSPSLTAFLREFESPTRPADLFDGAATAADVRFVDALVRTGTLRDADDPDPIHDLRPNPDLAATLYLYPTNSCNLRCVYCYATSGPGAGPRLSIEHALMAVDDFFDTLGAGVRRVDLRFHGGGEPTTNFGVMTGAWQHFRDRATQRGLLPAVSTISNGTFGAPALRTFTTERWGLTISYDGPRQAAQRPTAADRDSRDRVVANLRALLEAGNPPVVRATLTRDGLPYLRELVDDAAEIGLPRVQVEPASVVGRGANLTDGPPDPEQFAYAFLDAFDHALKQGVRLSTAAWSHTRVGDGGYCGAISGMRALTPDGFISACTEACDGGTPDDPFIVGRLDSTTRRLEIWPVREQKLRGRVGYALPHCSTCYMVDTCGGGCASRAQAQHGDAFVRDEQHCVISRIVNPTMIAAIADGVLLPDDGWQPITAELRAEESSIPGAQARLVAMVPPFAKRRWNTDPNRAPFFAVPSTGGEPFFHLPR